MDKRNKRFKNGVLRSEVETIIMLTIDRFSPMPVMVKHFVSLGAFMDSKATEKQFSHVAQQMAQTGEIVQTTVGGNYQYQHWTDVNPA